MVSRDEILQHALALPPSDQAFVADMLEQKIAETNPVRLDLGEAWSREIDRRLDAFTSGESTCLDPSDSIELLRKALDRHRESRGNL